MKKVKQLNKISKITDNALMTGGITKEEHREIKKRIKDLELDNLFKAMEAFCKK